MNREFVTLSDEQLEMVTGGSSYAQTSQAVAYSTLAAANINTDVANVGKGTQNLSSNITQSAKDVAVAANFFGSFNH